jgi:hypothetical protein
MTEQNLASVETPKLRWYQFSLRSLFIFVTLCSVACSWFIIPTARARRLVADVTAGNLKKGSPPLGDFISERKARLASASILPITFNDLWRGRRTVRVDVPPDAEENLPSCFINYEVGHFETQLTSKVTRTSPGMPDWYIDYTNKWESLLKQAGKHSNGLVLESKLANNLDGSGPSLQLNVRNVGVQPLSITVGACEQPAKVLIRDESGNFAFMTPKGEEYHAPNVLWAGSVHRETLWPGDVRRADSIQLDSNFILNKHGTFTIIPIMSWGGIDTDVVSTPIQFTISRNSASKATAVVANPDDELSHVKTPRKDNTTGNDWAKLEAIAGLPQYSCVLEADVSPVIPNSFHVVASLICEGSDHRFSTSHAGAATEYRVLVRDCTGRLITMNEAARRVSASDIRVARSGPSGGSFIVGVYNGIGVIIPLAKWFDIKKPGEYTVLVSLPTRQKSNPLWVAKPFKFTVGNHIDPDLPNLKEDRD